MRLIRNAVFLASAALMAGSAAWAQEPQTPGYVTVENPGSDYVLAPGATVEVPFSIDFSNAQTSSVVSGLNGFDLLVNYDPAYLTLSSNFAQWASGSSSFYSQNSGWSALTVNPNYGTGVGYFGASTIDPISDVAALGVQSTFDISFTVNSNAPLSSTSLSISAQNDDYFDSASQILLETNGPLQVDVVTTEPSTGTVPAPSTLTGLLTGAFTVVCFLAARRLRRTKGVTKPCPAL